MPTVYTVRTGGQQGNDAAWVKALFVGPAVVGSFCALVLLGQTSAVKQGWRKLLGRSKPPPIAGGPQRLASLESLRTSVVGLAKPQVVALLGSPPAATAGPVSTWYYPIQPAEKLAMAIQFDHDHARVVEFFHAPA